jgi:sugar phosphate isomerase/epimerase
LREKGMKVTGCWMYVIDKYGFPPKLEDMFQGIRELKDLGFEYIELEGVGSENLLEVVHHKRDFLELFESLGVRISNFAVILPEIISMDRSVKERAIELFETGVKTARYLRSDYLWIDSYMPPVEVKEGKALSQSLEFGTEMKVKIPAGFSWSDFWENFVDSVKKCNRIAEKNGVQLLMEPRTGEVVSNSDALLRILEAVGSENFGVILDTAHQHAAKEILPLSVEKLGKNIKYVHVADNDGGSDRHLVPGDGTIDWEEIFVSLKKIGYDGYYAIDLESLPDIDQRFLECKKFLEDYGRKLSL